ERTKAARFEVDDVDQPDKVNPFVPETIPAFTFGVLAIALQKIFGVGQDIMLAGHIEDLARFGALEHLIDRVEFRGFGQVAEVAGVNDEVGRLRHRVDAVDGLLEGGGHIRVWRFVEPDVAVADLDKCEILTSGAGRLIAKDFGPENAATHGVDNAGAYPAH